MAQIEVFGDIVDVEVIAAGRSLRALGRLRKVYGGGRWRKLKGIAIVRLPDGVVTRAELHWYEAHGVGKRELKIKRILSD